MAGELHEKCAVAGVFLEDEAINAAAAAYEILFAQQHRGTEATGIATEGPDGRILEHRGEGSVKDVYNQVVIDGLSSVLAIGHNRYATSGNKKGTHLQPVLEESVELALS